MEKLTYKAVAQEHSHGDDGYYAGEGIVFSNSALDAIKKAKKLAYDRLSQSEAEAEDSAVSILATIEVFKNGKRSAFLLKNFKALAAFLTSWIVVVSHTFSHYFSPD